MAKKKRGPGRPTKLTPQVHAAIIGAITVGSFFEEAAEAADVSRSVAYAWLEQGRADQDAGKVTDHSEFLDAVTRAKAKDAVRDLALITKASQSKVGAVDWKAAAWKRERKDSRWITKVRVTIEQELEGFLDELERVLPPEWYAKALEVAVSRLGSSAAGGTEG